MLAVNSSLPLVSILMTSYNREEYIGKAIESVLLSTYQNFELIIVDDCSDDRTVEIAKSYAATDHRIKVFVNNKNLGDYPNRNKAASYAIGKYLKYLDSDDFIYPYGLQILVSAMEKFPEADWGLCSLPQDTEQPYPFMLNPKESYTYNYFKRSIFHKAPLSAIIKNNCFKEIGGFSGKQYLGDYELWHLLALKYNVILVQDGVVWNREHSQQQSNANRLNPEVKFKYRVSALNFLKKCSDVPLTNNQKQLIKNRIKRQINLLLLVKFFRLKWKVVINLNRIRKDKSLNFGDYL